MIILKILIASVALLHFYILILEMFLWTTQKGLKTFRMSLDHAKTTAVLASNQGLYNGFLAAGLLWSLFYPDEYFAKQISIFFLGCVVIAGAYGGYSVNRRIFFIQGVPAFITLLLTLFI